MTTTLFKRGFLPRLSTCRGISMAAVTGTASSSQHPPPPFPSQLQGQQPKREGDISDSFASLSGKEASSLPDRFRDLKLSLVAGHEDRVISSWKGLLKALKAENAIIAAKGSSIIPEVQYSNLDSDLARVKDEIRKRGAAVVRGVIPEAEARAYKEEIEEYVRKNPQTRGFPPSNPQVIELYWSASQLRARSHPHLLHAQKSLMQHLWHASSPTAPVSLSHPLTYADRLRIRQPGDAQFALGPHQDGGSVERWERDGYGRGGVYDAVFTGNWEDYDAWDAGRRAVAAQDLYAGLGASSVFRAFQGWLSMSNSGAGEGTLLVNPAVALSAAYSLLRPFFRSVKALQEFEGETAREKFLDERNWVFTAGEEMTSELHGATPGHGQEFPGFETHPHLELDRTMVHMPRVKPGDFVVWHCDTIHAVDKTHRGTSDSSVLYIPVCPTTENNARYVARQRAAFLEGTPGPDFPGGKGESEHVGRPTEQYLRSISDSVSLQSMGFEKLVAEEGSTPGMKGAVGKANHILGQ